MPAAATAATTAPPKPQAPLSRLGAVKRERLRAPLRYMFYGAEGTGKSTLASAAPEPIWLDADDGSGRLNVARYQFRDEPGGHVPQRYSEILFAIQDLTVNPHPFKTLVLDTVDRIEAMLWQHIIERESEPSARGKDGSLTSIESFGYGKGYVMAVDEWRALCARLDRLRANRGMSVVLIAHSIVKAYKNPTGPDYDRYQPALHDKAAGFLKGWCDLTGFVRHEDDAAKELGNKNGRPKGFSTGRRLLMLSHSAAFDAKSRLALPEEVEIDIENPWAPLAAAVEAGYENEVPALKAAIEDEVKRIGDQALPAKVASAVAGAKDDPAALSRILAKLKDRPTVANESQQ